MLRLITSFFIIFMFLVTGLFAQTTCFFISSDPDPGSSLDADLISWLQGKDYLVTVVDDNEVLDGNAYYTLEDVKTFDFAFISETVGSNNTSLLKGAPIPIMYTENWATKMSVTGWGPHEISDNSLYGSTGISAGIDNVVKISDGSHALAAGFATGTDVTIVDNTDADAMLTYSKLPINHISIAALASDATMEIVFGVEEGTFIYDATEHLSDTMKTKSRAASVGIHGNANLYITEDGYTLIEAGINWILEPPAAIDSEPIVSPNSYSLTQNYPNPFNPVTHIAYTLEQGGYVNLTVYNVLGQQVATLVDGISAAGINRVSFDASGLQSGVYFYTLTAGDYTETKKMMLVK